MRYLISKIMLVALLAGCSDDGSPKTDTGTDQAPARDVVTAKDTKATPDNMPADDVMVAKDVMGDTSTPDQQQGCVHPSVTKKCSAGWCEIPAGCFTMGSPTSEPCRDADETPHEVTLTRSFSISDSEVTQSEFNAKMGYNPSDNKGCDDCPVESVTWYEAVAYCNKLSADASLTACYECSGSELATRCTVAAKYGADQNGLYACPGYRLPTPAEWEYAARAGTKTSLHNGDLVQANCTGTDTLVDAVAWYDKNSGGKTHAVRGKGVNAWGLFDMSGNVFEWTADGWKTDWGAGAQTDPWVATLDVSRRMRGGSFKTPAKIQRIANRASKTVGDPTALRYDELGFRCVRSLTGTTP